MAVRPTPRITRGDITLSARVWALIQHARDEANLAPERCRVVQGSWAAGRLSAGTHTGGGTFDLGAVLIDEDDALRLVIELRRLCGPSVWLRSPRYGWPPSLSASHIHGVVRDEPGLSRAARAQIRSADRGRNGLANQASDPHKRVQWRGFALWGTPSAYPGRLQRGSSGPAVADLQRALEIVPDGLFGRQTHSRVKAFQRRRPALWPADGIVGPMTYAAILDWGWR